MTGKTTLQATVTLICILLSFSIEAQTFTVTNSNNAGAGSFRQAILDAPDGGTIVFDASTTGNPIILTGGEMVIDNSITIVGNSATSTVVSGNNASRVFMITGAGNVTINNLTLTNGMAADTGGAIHAMNSNLTMNNVTISESTADGDAAAQGGGGIYCKGGILTLNGCEISNNEATGTSGSGGGILMGTGGTLNANSTTISENFANRAGGGIEGNSGSAITLNGVTLDENMTGTNPGNGGGLHITGAGNTTINAGIVSGNEAAAEGGGLWNGTGTMTIEGAVISENVADGDGADQGGGGIYNLNGGTLTILNATISDNEATGTLGSGGGILNDVGSMLTISGTEISGNTAVRAGGGVEDNSGTSTITFTDVELTGNSVTGPPGNGGGLHITGGGSAVFTGGTVNDNTAALQGGGLWVGSGTLTLNNVDIDGNTAAGAAATDGGGGIFNVSGTLNITNSVIANNMATGAAGSGGGIFSAAGNATIVNTPVKNNSANRAGGGIEVIAGTYTINNADISDNDVDGSAGVPNPGNGGGVHISGASTFVINGGLIDSNNARREGGGLWNQTGSTMTVNSATLRNNTASGPAEDDGGGAIFNNGGTLMVNESTLSGNSADGLLGTGGAVHINAGSATLMLSTISGNTSLSTGGGIYNNAELMINANTITLNSATTSGGGIYNNSAIAPMVKNTIVSGNNALISGPDVFSDDANITSGGYNLIGISNDDFTSNNNDLTGTTASPLNASLMPLADNGGDTFTHALDCPSAAADMGDMADAFDDQAGQAVFNGRRDIGAYEAQETCALATESIVAANSKSRIYPNPAVNGSFNVLLAESHNESASITIYELATGKLIKTAAAEHMQMQIDVTNLSSGTYIIQIVSDATAETQMVIIAK